MNIDEYQQWEENFDEKYPHFRPDRKRSPLLQRFFSKERKWLHITLFVLTIFSTYLVSGFLYSVAIMSILLAHEMGHYLMCRRYGVPATLPFFVPMPFSPFGTLGAVIAMGNIMPNRRALFDVGAAGPLAGLVLALPVTVIGLKYSTIINPAELGGAALSMGEPLVFRFLRYLVLGPVPEGMDVLVHPLAYAGWVGLFVTALNLLPVGQLDGGHIAYALFGQNSRYVYYVALGGFAIATIFFPGWILMLFLLAFFFLRHPPTMADYIPLDRKRKVLGILLFVVFVVSFTPVPFHI